MLRTPNLKPYIIYVKAPQFSRLKETRHQAFARSTFDETSSRSFTVKIIKYYTLKLCYMKLYLQYFMRTNLRRKTFTLTVFQDDEFHAMLKAGDRIEKLYGHWFDLAITNEDLNLAFEHLVRAVRRLDQDAHWVPASWVQQKKISSIFFYIQVITNIPYFQLYSRLHLVRFSTLFLCKFYIMTFFILPQMIFNQGKKRNRCLMMETENIKALRSQQYVFSFKKERINLTYVFMHQPQNGK